MARPELIGVRATMYVGRPRTQQNDTSPRTGATLRWIKSRRREVKLGTNVSEP